jgi:UDP-N-acetylmuramoylalanine-D-glutamate ligase
MARVAEAGGVVYVDDSKGTTVAATQAALDGIDRPVVLIAGGDGKGQDFSPLAPVVDAHCRTVLLIGRDAPILERALTGTRAAVERVGTLDAAVRRAVQLARPGDAWCFRRPARPRPFSTTWSAGCATRGACRQVAGERRCVKRRHRRVGRSAC